VEDDVSRLREIDICEETTASPEIVYGLLTNASTWPQWTSIQAVTLERTGTPPPEGVGAIRVNHRGRVTGRDEITELVPNRRFAYTSLSGLPVRDYNAHVDVAPTATGATIRWRASFRPTIPGTGRVMQRGIERFLAECASGLARYAAAPAA
jgi:uncharacterized protein YndB with AHSA1/START domain